VTLTLGRCGHKTRGLGSRLAQWFDALTGGRLREVEAVALGDDDVGVAQEPIDGGGGQGFGRDFIEPRWVQVGANRHRAALVVSVDEAVTACGGHTRLPGP
jgi:hypothetical protein